MHGQKAADIRQLQEVPGATEAVLPQTGIQRQHGQIDLPAPERFRIPPEVRFHVPVPDGVLALPVPPVQIPGMKDRPAFRRHQKGHALVGGGQCLHLSLIHIFLIGPENVSEALQDTSVVVASYDIGNDMRGLIGVVGPTRMDYGTVAARLSGFAEGLTRLFGKQELPPKEDAKE